MNYAQLSAYLQAYLQTNDANVIANIPNFMSLAASRMKSDIRNSLIEQSIALEPVASQGIPPGFVAVRLININGVPQAWQTNQALSEGATGFAIVAQNIVFNPEPETTDVITLVYYVINQDNELALNVPHIMLHAAAAEGELYQGDMEAAANEQAVYQRDIDNSNGWDFQGPIGMGQGVTPTGTGSGGTSGGGGIPTPTPAVAAVNVSVVPTGNLSSSNVQDALVELQGDIDAGGGGGGGTVTLQGSVTGTGNIGTPINTTVVTNANLNGMVTSVGNSTTVVTNANLSGAVTSAGNVTSLGSFTLAALNAAVGWTLAAINAAQNWLLPQRSAPTTDNDLSFDLTVANNFNCTPTAGGVLTFTNLTQIGQSGLIRLVNGGNYSITKAASVKCSSSMLATISASGTYLLSYYCDGTSVFVSNTSALA